jgi:hypothetical protein
MKAHFVLSILFTIFYGLQIITEDPNTRMILTIPTIIFFFSTFLMYTIEYDKKRSEAWKKKEKKLIESVYSDFIKKLYKVKNKGDLTLEMIEKARDDWLKKRLEEF